MLILKKIIGYVLLPFSLSIVLSFFGVILLLMTKRQKTGKVLTTLGFILLLATSTEYVPYILLKPLEKEFPPIMVRTDLQSMKDERTGVKWIVVLGGGHNSDPHVPMTSRLSLASITRLNEGMRLLKEMPKAKLLLSGGMIMDTVSDALAMERVALALGVQQSDIILEAKSLDTEEQAVNIQPMVGRERMILVTSAAHMPRAMGLFEKEGMRPIPAPTDFALNDRSTLGMYFPNTSSLEQTRIAIYEYLGMGWAKMRGKM